MLTKNSNTQKKTKMTVKQLLIAETILICTKKYNQIKLSAFNNHR